MPKSRTSIVQQDMFSLSQENEFPQTMSQVEELLSDSDLAAKVGSFQGKYKDQAMAIVQEELNNHNGHVDQLLKSRIESKLMVLAKQRFLEYLNLHKKTLTDHKRNLEESVVLASLLIQSSNFSDMLSLRPIQRINLNVFRSLLSSYEHLEIEQENQVDIKLVITIDESQEQTPSESFFLNICNELGIKLEKIFDDNDYRRSVESYKLLITLKSSETIELLKKALAKLGIDSSVYSGAEA